MRKDMCAFGGGVDGDAKCRLGVCEKYCEKKSPRKKYP
jgi:hypothetical protein